MSIIYKGKVLAGNNTILSINDIVKQVDNGVKEIEDAKTQAVQEISTLIDTKADVDLDNLSEAGELRFSEKANIGLENTEPVQSFINKSISWSIPDLPESSPFATNQITWNTAFQLPCDSLIIIGGTGTNALNLKYSLDNSNYQNIWQNSGTAAYITFAVVLPKGVYVKGTGGGGSQTLSYIPLKGAKV